MSRLGDPRENRDAADDDEEAERRFGNITSELGEAGVCTLLSEATDFRSAREPIPRRSPMDSMDIVTKKTRYLQRHLNPHHIVEYMDRAEKLERKSYIRHADTESKPGKVTQVNGSWFAGTFLGKFLGYKTTTTTATDQLVPTDYYTLPPKPEEEKATDDDEPALSVADGQQLVVSRVESLIGMNGFDGTIRILNSGIESLLPKTLKPLTPRPREEVSAIIRCNDILREVTYIHGAENAEMYMEDMAVLMGIRRREYYGAKGRGGDEGDESAPEEAIEEASENGTSPAASLAVEGEEGVEDGDQLELQDEHPDVGTGGASVNKVLHEREDEEDVDYSSKRMRLSSTCEGREGQKVDQ